MRPVPSSLLNSKALRSGDRARPEETLVVPFDPLRPRVPQMCCPREENLRRFYRGLKAFSPPSPHTGLLPGLNSTVSDKEIQSG